MNPSKHITKRNTNKVSKKKTQKNKRSTKTTIKKKAAIIEPSVSMLNFKYCLDDSQFNDLKYFDLVSKMTSETFPSESMDDIVSFLVFLANDPLVFSRCMNQTFKKIYDIEMNYSDYCSSNLYEYIKDDYEISNEIVSKDFDIVEMEQSMNAPTPFSLYYEKIDKQKVKSHLIRNMAGWMHNNIHETCIFYGDYFCGMVNLWKQLDMLKDKEVNEFHTGCIMYMMKLIKEYRTEMSDDYLQFVRHNDDGHKTTVLDDSDFDHNLEDIEEENRDAVIQSRLEQALEDKNEIFHQVKSWGGLHPYCKFIDGKDTVDQFFEKMIFRSSYYFANWGLYH